MYDSPNQMYLLTKLVQQKMHEQFTEVKDARRFHQALPLRARVAQLLRRLALRLDPQDDTQPGSVQQSCT